MSATNPQTSDKTSMACRISLDIGTARINPSASEATVISSRMEPKLKRQRAGAGGVGSKGSGSEALGPGMFVVGVKADGQCC